MQKIKIKLLKPHTHAWEDLQPGAVIEVWPDQAAWLETEGVAVIETETKPDKMTEGKK